MEGKNIKSKHRAGDLFALAEAVSLLYGHDEAEGVIEEFRDVAESYRGVTQAQGQVEWLTYVLRLLLACPVLLSRPPGFEWVTDDLGRGRPGTEIAVKVLEAFVTAGFRTFYLVPPILRGGRRDYEAAQAVLEAFRS